jgi:hypothetical protein
MVDFGASHDRYLSAYGQLIASFVRGNGHQIPPLTDARPEKIAALFHGPFPGLGGPETSNGRCGSMRGAKDMGETPMCKNTTDDGRLYLSLEEIQARCAADAHCAGFSQDTKDGPSYFRPLSATKTLENDRKWTTWTKGAEPPHHAGPSPSPGPSPPPTPKDWYEIVDIPYCLATAPSTAPPTEPSQPPAITTYARKQFSSVHPSNHPSNPFVPSILSIHPSI